MIEDGRNVGITIALKHLLEVLERKGIVPFDERQKMLDDVGHELDHMPALQGEARNDAKRTIRAFMGSRLDEMISGHHTEPAQRDEASLSILT